MYSITHTRIAETSLLPANVKSMMLITAVAEELDKAVINYEYRYENDEVYLVVFGRYAEKVTCDSDYNCFTFHCVDKSTWVFSFYNSDWNTTMLQYITPLPDSDNLESTVNVVMSALGYDNKSTDWVKCYDDVHNPDSIDTEDPRF